MQTSSRQPRKTDQITRVDYQRRHRGWGKGWEGRNTKGDGDEDERGPQPLPGGEGELEPAEIHVPHPGLVEGRVTRGCVCTDVLVKDGHGDHGLRGVQHVVHHDEEVAVHRLD